MDWTIKPHEQANHPPTPKLDHEEIIIAKPGEKIHLGATGSTDPDGDAISFNWIVYKEAGTFATSNARIGMAISVKNFDQPKAWFEVPTSRVMAPGTGTIHVILAVNDHGSPRLTRYKRIIINVK